MTPPGGRQCLQPTSYYAGPAVRGCNPPAGPNYLQTVPLLYRYHRLVLYKSLRIKHDAMHLVCLSAWGILTDTLTKQFWVAYTFPSNHDESKHQFHLTVLPLYYSMEVFWPLFADTTDQFSLNLKPYQYLTESTSLRLIWFTCIIKFVTCTYALSITRQKC